MDAVSWRSLQNSQLYDYKSPYQTSAESLRFHPKAPQETYPDVPIRRQRPKAQPQVPLYGKMGRRASDGCALLSDTYFDHPADYSGVNSDTDEMVINNNNTKMKMMYKYENPELRYPNKAGCRLSLDAGRRESSSSLTSSLADGSKDSLTSFDSTSTLTGHETDDSAIMSRYRRSFQQKEEFLKMPPPPPAAEPLIQREYYSRPKKLENRALWPPERLQDTPNISKIKPTHQHFQRVKNDIDTERDLFLQSQNNGYFDGENDDVFVDDRKMPGLQIVHKRTREFERGKPLPEDDPVLGNRTSFYRSELARLSSKRVVPNVTERAQEYEIRTVEPRRDTSSSSIAASSPPIKRIQSLESSGK